MQRGCMKNAALVLDQKTFSFQRKLNFNFTQKNFFYQNCVCEMVEPKFETEFWPMYWVSSGGWWLYSLVYPHRFSRSQEFFYNWLQVLNMLGFINKNKILAFFPAMAATQTLLYLCPISSCTFSHSLRDGDNQQDQERAHFMTRHSDVKHIDNLHFIRLWKA